MAWMASSGTDVTLTWQTLTSVTIDEPSGAQIGTPTSFSETVKGFIHFPEIALKQVKMFAEIEMGDIIVDLPPDTTIEGRDHLEFTINGEKWVQKTIGNTLAKAWDTVHENSRLCRTLLLRKTT